MHTKHMRVTIIRCKNSVSFDSQLHNEWKIEVSKKPKKPLYGLIEVGVDVDKISISFLNTDLINDT